MSINMFFLACDREELEKIVENNDLISQLLEKKSYLLSTDVEAAWDVLRSVLGGIGIEAGELIDQELFNGCFLISGDEVRAEAKKLAEWSRENVLDHLQSIDKNSDLYHLDVFQNDEEYFFEQFQKMAAFYKEAAEKSLSAISYIA